jgi:hypothetical protein
MLADLAHYCQIIKIIISCRNLTSYTKKLTMNLWFVLIVKYIEAPSNIFVLK